MASLLLFADDAIRIAAQTYTKPGTDTNDDISSYQKSYFIKTERKSKREAFANNWNQLKWSSSQALWGVPSVAFSSSKMQAGEILPTSIGIGTGLASFPLLSSVISPGIRWALAPLSIGTAGTAAVAMLLAIKPAFALGQAAAKSIRWFSQFDYKTRHLEMGGSYSDSLTALALRTRAMGEMSGALSYSRRFLGNEALYMR